MPKTLVDKFLDSNINLSAPETKAEWDNLIQQLYENKTYFHSQYEKSPHIPEIYLIVYAEKQEIEIPRKLAKVGSGLTKLTAEVKQKDLTLNKTIKQYVKTATASNDEFIIDMATNLVKKALNNS